MTMTQDWRLPILVIDDVPKQGVLSDQKLGGRRVPAIERHHLPEGIDADPKKLFDLKWITTTRESLMYRALIRQSRIDPREVFLPLVIIADYQLREEMYGVYKIYEDSEHFPTISVFPSDAIAKDLERQVVDALEQENGPRQAERGELAGGMGDRRGLNSDGCLAAGLIANDLQGWPIVAVSNTMHTASAVAETTGAIYEAHFAISGLESLRAAEGLRSWTELLPAASRHLRKRIRKSVAAGTLTVGWNGIKRLCEIKADTADDLGVLTLSVHSYSRGCAVRALFMDVADEDITGAVCSWAQEIYAAASSRDRFDEDDFIRDRLAERISEDLWEERDRRAALVFKRLHWFDKAPDSATDADDAIHVASDGISLAEASVLDVRSFLDAHGRSGDAELLRRIILLQFVRLLKLRSAVNDPWIQEYQETGIPNYFVGAPIVPEDLLFAIAPIVRGRLQLARGHVMRWNSLKTAVGNALGAEFLERVVEGEGICAHDRWLMRSFASDPLDLDRSWWANDRQASTVLGKP